MNTKSEESDMNTKKAFSAPGSRRKGKGSHRGRTRKVLLDGVVITGLVLGMAACGGTGSSASTTTAAKSSGVVLNSWKAHGVSLGLVQQPPYSGVAQNGKMVGIGPDIATTVLRALGVKKEIRASVGTYASVIPGLNAGRWDMIAATLTVTPTRCQAILFSNPVVETPWSLAVARGNPDGLKSVKSVVAKHGVIGALQGSSVLSVLASLGATVDQFPDEATAISALAAGRIAALIDNTAGLTGLPSSLRSEVTITPPVPDVPPVYDALGFQEGESSLVTVFDRELKQLWATGKFEQISKKWGFTVYKGMESVSAQQLCRSGS